MKRCQSCAELDELLSMYITMDNRLLEFFLVVLLSERAFCDPFNLHGKYGEFSSNNFPKFYENNLNQTWTITVEKGYYVELFFNAFDLEDSYDDGVRCPSDYIEIFDGDVNSNRSSGRLCGNSDLYPDDAPQPYVYKYQTTGNVASLRFVSDYSNDLPDSPAPTGFKATYSAKDIDECAVLEAKYARAIYPEMVGKCDHYCNNFLGSYSCSCKDGYILSHDGYTCAGKCAEMYTRSSSGVITSPGYPDNYPKKTDCDWTIETDIGQVIELDFDEAFAIEDYRNSTCPYDWLQIDNGQHSKTYCGPQAPVGPIESFGNVVKIQFHSDMVLEMKGFRISHRTKGIYCPLPTPPEHGRVSETYGAEYGRLPFDSVVVFECERGYEMNGIHKITCLKDGTFDDDIPTCEPEK